MRDAADDTLESSAFELDYEINMVFNEAQRLSLEASGPVDYEGPIGDIEMNVDQNGQKQDVAIKADGTNVWVKSGAATNNQWVEGEAQLLAESETFKPEGLIGVLYALRATEEAEAGESSEVDGVEGREYTTTIAYEDAVDAAGSDAEQFSSNFSLTGAAASADLDVTVWIGDDGLIRDFDMEIVHDNVEGGADLELRNMGGDIAAPDAPAAGETITGPQADQLLSQLIQ